MIVTLLLNVGVILSTVVAGCAAVVWVALGAIVRAVRERR